MNFLKIDRYNLFDSLCQYNDSYSTKTYDKNLQKTHFKVLVQAVK